MTIAQLFQVRQHGRVVLVLLAGELAAALTHEAARELGRLVRATAEAALLAPGVEVAPQSVRSGRFRVTVRSDGAELIFVFEPARFLVRWPPAEFGKVFGALVAQAARAEEWEQADRVARDHAILFRAGAPVGLTDHPAIRAEALKFARDDRELRRFMPGGIRSTSMPGVPKIELDSRTPLERAKDAVRKMPPNERAALAETLRGTP